MYDKGMEEENTKHIGGVRLLPSGVTPSEEVFCREYVRSKSAGAAYNLAYKQRSVSDAERLAEDILQRKRIKIRVAQLLEEATQGTVNTEMVIVMLRRTYEAAMQAGRFEAANGSAKLMGEYLHMFDQTRKVQNAVTITHKHEIDKELARLAKIAEVPLKLIEDATFTPVEINDDKDSTGQESGAGEEVAQADIRPVDPVTLQ